MINKEIAERLGLIVCEFEDLFNDFECVYKLPGLVNRDKLMDNAQERGEEYIGHIQSIRYELEHPKEIKDNISFENRMPMLISKPKGWEDDE